MKKEYAADNVLGKAIYLFCALTSIGLWHEEIIPTLAAAVFLLFIAALYAVNHHYFRLELDDEGISGPSRYGPMVRTKILWPQAEVHFSRKRGFLRVLEITQPHDAKIIRIAELNFMKETLETLKKEICKHHPAKVTRPVT